jgi:tetratricopeptide (TPR) repeat protein
MQTSKLNAAAMMTACLILAATLWGQAQGQQAQQPQWKDRAEYDLYMEITKAPDHNKKIELLNQWQQKYPDSAFKEQRMALLMESYLATNQVDRALQVGNEILAINPKDIRTIYLMTANALRLTNPTAEQLALAEKAARTLVTNLDELKPATMSAADWEKGKPDLLAAGHTTLAWVASQRKDFRGAEKEFMASLKANPNNSQVSYWLAGVIREQKDPDKQSDVLFHYARAAFHTGPGALTEQGRKEVEKYVTQLYSKFHGSMDGFEDLRKLASESAFPPEGFKILSVYEVSAMKEEEFRKSNPMLALWMTVKKELTGPNGAQYFESSVKGALLPGGVNDVKRFKATLIEAKPAKNPKQLIVAIADKETPEVTLVLEEPLIGSAPKGTEIEFEGVATAFSADPFNLTFEVEKGQISGWPTPAPTKKAPAAKKAAPAKTQ